MKVPFRSPFTIVSLLVGTNFTTIDARLYFMKPDPARELAKKNEKNGGKSYAASEVIAVTSLNATNSLFQTVETKVRYKIPDK
mmetsp:Transcript_10674/g.15411  ORF Transcript_10674/g.15411 Transcript_10674/m.15411 type:complete len:83 (+) Transcript_10674:307-555(+)